MLLVDGGQVMNSTTNEGTNTGCHFEDENISKVGGAEIQSPNDESTPNAEDESPEVAERSPRVECGTSAGHEIDESREIIAHTDTVGQECSTTGKQTEHERINVTVISNKQRRIVQKMQCQGCQRSFGNTSALTRHGPFCKNISSDNVLTDVSLRYECPQCKKTFSSKGYLKQHQINSKYCKRVQAEELALALSETNSSTSSFKCNGCCKEFSQKTSLKSHKNSCSHLNLASHETNTANEVSISLDCSLCAQSFKSKSGLTTHKKFCLLKQKSQSHLVDKPDASSLSETTDSHSSDMSSRNNTKADTHHPQLETSQPNQEGPELAVASQSVEKTQPQQVDMSLTMQQPPLEAVSSLKCPLCPRVCKNKGSLASHRKACEVKNNPSNLKTRRRLSKSLNVGLRHPEDQERRLSTTLLVKEV